MDARFHNRRLSPDAVRWMLASEPVAEPTVRSTHEDTSTSMNRTKPHFTHT